MDTQSTPPKRDTPPDSFTNQPLTPSPADARSDSVSRIIKEVRNRQQGRSWTDITWANYTLDPEGYEDLLHRFQSDEDLWGYVDDKLQYEQLQLIPLLLYVWLIYTVAITSPPLIDSSFDRAHSYTDYFWGVSCRKSINS